MMSWWLTKSVLNSDWLPDVSRVGLSSCIHSHDSEAVQGTFLQVDHLKLGLLAWVWSLVHLKTAAAVVLYYIPFTEKQCEGLGVIKPNPLGIKFNGNLLVGFSSRSLTLHHSSSPAFWNSSRYPKIFPLPVSVGGCQDRVTDSLVKSMARKFTGGLGFTVTKDSQEFL